MRNQWCIIITKRKFIPESNNFYGSVWNEGSIELIFFLISLPERCCSLKRFPSSRISSSRPPTHIGVVTIEIYQPIINTPNSYIQSGITIFTVCVFSLYAVSEVKINCTGRLALSFCLITKFMFFPSHNFQGPSPQEEDYVHEIRPFKINN